MRIHLSAGAVYLESYINVDVPSAHTFLASERPDLVEKWRTSEDRYYEKHSDKTIASLREGPLDQEYVADRFGSFSFLPVRLGEVDEVLCRHAFEHLSLSEARQALALLNLHIKPGGVLRLDVPDHDKTLKLYAQTSDPFFVRHLLGPRRGDDFGHHTMSYEPEQLKKLVESYGFKFDREEENIHVYPALCIRFIRV